MENLNETLERQEDEKTELRCIDCFKKFELQEENGVYFVFKKSDKGGARIGLLLHEDGCLFYYSSEGMAYTHTSLSELSEFLHHLEQCKDSIDIFKQ